jgi:hypothetical protein
MGPRFIELTFSQRLYLVWIFRHFETLPLQVLSNRQRALIDALCLQQQSLSMYPTNTAEDFSVIGSVERRPPVEVEAQLPRRPNARVVDALASMATDLRQRF